MTEQENKTVEQLKRLSSMLGTIGETEDYTEVAINALEELEQYHAIGTVEECRAAVEKQDKITEQIETKILGKVCIGCGYLRDNICTYKGSNCGVSKPMYEDIKQVFEELKGGGVNE